MPRSTSDI